ncbi:MAG: putative DNA-binding domain-containing protein [Planctomycetaceae bacterium]|nr:putative DNA-binding domain-containing protein [Planctomycetaceae bacterium]
MSGSPSLERLQRWMLGVITHPEGIAAGIEAVTTRREVDVTTEDVEQVITRSRDCTSIERLAVYGHAYFVRLLECLQAEFRVLAQASGEDAFNGFCVGYLQSHPSTSYTLGQLGAGLPLYLAATRPPRDPERNGPDWADFLVDLARLERTYSEVFDGPGEEGVPPLDADLFRQTPPDQWEHLQILLSPSLRLLRLSFPVHEYFAAVRAGESPELPAPRTVDLAIHRRQYVVQRREVTSAQATLLSALQSGRPLGDALDHTIAAHNLGSASSLPPIENWFRDWTASGLICGVQLVSG